MVAAVLPPAAVLLFVVTAIIIARRHVAGADYAGDLMRGDGRDVALSAATVARNVSYWFGRAVLGPALVYGLIRLSVWTAARVLRASPPPNVRTPYLIAALGVLGLAQLSELVTSSDTGTACRLAFLAAAIFTLWWQTRLRWPAAAIAAAVFVTAVGASLFGLRAITGTLANTLHQTEVAGTSPSPEMDVSSSAGSSPRMPDPAIVQRAREVSQYKLRQIHLALEIYRARIDPDGPATLAELSRVNLPPEMLRPPVLVQTYGFRSFRPDASPRSVVAYEQGDRTLMGGVDVLFHDGTVTFYPGDAADAVLAAVPPPPAIADAALINAAAGSAPYAAPVRTPTAPPAVPTLPAAGTPPRPAVPPDLSDRVASLGRLAAACRSYAAAHGGRYPRMGHDLAAAGLLSAADVNGMSRMGLFLTPNLPRGNPLPADVVVASEWDPATATHTVLFGDWHVAATIASADWPAVNGRSYQARAAAHGWRR